MFSLSRRWIAIVLLVAVLKTVLAAFAVVTSEFGTFMQMAQYDFLSLSHGILPFNGVYTGMGIFLAAFYGLWLALPINHADQTLLILTLKLPMLVFDFLAGALIYFAIEAVTKSTSNARKGFLIWYLNPYNIPLIVMYGSVDIIPPVFLLLTVILGYKHRWALAGLSLAVASILRVFPVLLFPAVLLYVLTQGRRATIMLTATFLAPLAAAFSVLIAMFGSVQAVVGTLTKLPLEESYLIFFGHEIPSSILANYALHVVLFMFLLQLFIMRSFWKTLGTSSLISPMLAFLLILFAGTVQQFYHFSWVTPLLTADYVINQRRPRMLLLVFLSAFISWLSLVMYYGGPVVTDFLLFPLLNQDVRTAAELILTLRPVLSDTRILFAGIFVGLLVCLLISLNAKSMRLAPIQSLGHQEIGPTCSGDGW
jgi:hypothetical protein